ncbi:hypothetical protein T440DRAFT_506530 [Plenodomus tracheiphilus IPT5]|uniref:Uncharacterized protein n=1 Tax=Plenodomus tracheiphilus IPT5 TaxID=1408161 RepID=A0A6A7BEM3_9PLEO|nr:hypothetical protein T440DRAFT_506530 [Plenodomus tracheiphilus IPT5]
MKRKFSFNLGPVKTASKTEPGAVATQSQSPQPRPKPEPTPPPSASHSHKTHASKDSICDNSPFISRRPLDAHTEQELRLACRAILQNFKPSDHGMENTDPKLDFGAMQRRNDSKSQATQVRVRAPTGAPPELQKSTSLRRSKTRTRAKADLEIKARTQQGDLPVRANSSRKRADFAWLDERDDKREEKLKTYGKASIDIPRPAAQLNDSDEDITLPVTVASTLAHSKVASTAPTSASLPSGGSSNRRSHQEHPAAIADAQAAEWMAKELEKKKRQDALQPQARPSTAVRPPSRSASIKENIKGYVFPGNRSRALSRAQSKESLRQSEGGEDQDLQRSGSWRKWAMPRRSGSRSRPGTSSGQPDDTDQPRKSESGQVNLNRELPPLPGLDQWKESEQPKEEKIASPKSPIAETHIASLMRPQEQAQERSPAADRQHRRSGSDTLAMQYTHAYPPRGSSRNPQDTPLSPRRAPPPVPDTPNTMMNSWASSNIDQRLEFPSSTHTRQRSGESVPTTPGTASVEAANFSRKMSVDSSPRHTTVSNEPKPVKKEEQKSRLKRVFTGWMTRKDKKDDWMHKLEKEGIQEGVLVQDAPSASPVVRY